MAEGGGLERTLAELRRCSSAGGRRELGAYSLEGTRLVERALRACVRLRSVVCSAEFAASSDSRELSLLAAIRALPETQLFVTDKERLAEFTVGRSYGDVLAIAELPHELELAACLRESANSARPTLLCVLDADDPGNVGALVRTALALGARAFVALGLTDAHHPKAVRTSMGAVFRLPVLHRADPLDFLRELRAAGGRSCGAVSSAGVPLRRVARGAWPMALFLGSEAHGLPASLTAQLDQLVTIPMVSDVDSLSINAAAAICLHALTSID